nr:hypothetical protein GCM10020093_098820 [Planobispora longispora]
MLADAYTQLGRYGEAERAIDRMMELRPGVASFTRAAYAAELRGDRAGARRMLDRALGDAFSLDDVAYCHYSLGELALHSGDLAGASERYRLALRAAPGSPRRWPAPPGPRRSTAGRPRPSTCTRPWSSGSPAPVRDRVRRGDPRLGRGSVRPVDPAAGAAGPDDGRGGAGRRDLGRVRGGPRLPAEAVAYARAEYARNPNLVAADALAWALHRDGRSEEALPYARKATATGWRNALLLHHRAEIERAAGLTERAGKSAAEARRANPAFSPRLPALARFS